MLIWGVGNVLEDGDGADQRYPGFPSGRVSGSDRQGSGVVGRSENVFTVPRDGEKEEGQGTVVVAAV